MDNFERARILALIVPLALLGGALASQYIGGLYPCEMCHWQRWPHYAALPLAALAFAPMARGVQATLVALAALAVITSGTIGIHHAGVEYGWWQGMTACSNVAAGTTLEDIMAAPLVRCDVTQWSLFGISLAGFNALISIPVGLYILLLIARMRSAA